MVCLVSRPVPAAGTTFDSEGNFVCNKGLVECMGHRWLSCVVEEAPDLGAKIEALACMESGDNKGLTWSAIVGKCFSGGALTKMKTCYDTKSEDLLRKVLTMSNLARRAHSNWHTNSCLVLVDSMSPPV